MKRRTTLAAGLLLGLTLTASGQAPSSVKFDSETISGLGARNIGSAAMSGRIAALDAVRGRRPPDRVTSAPPAAACGSPSTAAPPSSPSSTSSPCSRSAPSRSIPRIRRPCGSAPASRWTRNSVSIGDGIYKSIDGGENWTHMGLRGIGAHRRRSSSTRATRTRSTRAPRASSGAIPTSAASTGRPTAARPGRRCSRAANLSTGCSMISHGPAEPEDALRRHVGLPAQGLDVPLRRRRRRRRPAAAASSSRPTAARPGPSLSATSKGLPVEAVGAHRGGGRAVQAERRLRVHRSDAPKNGLFRSDDGGETWQAMDRSQNMVWRPFYFAHLIVDPKNPNKLYKPDLALIASQRRRQELHATSAAAAHGDFHDLWINPTNTRPRDRRRRRRASGTRYDGGNSWWKGDNLPISQFYHVSVDMDRPYHVYGGLQDNSSWVGDVRVPRRHHQRAAGRTCTAATASGCSPTRPIPTTSTPRRRAARSGASTARRTRTRNIKPLPGYRRAKLRFNWNTPIHMSPTQKGTSTSARSSSSARATRARPGSASRPT